MAKRQTHIKDCERLLGKGFDHIHADLDRYATKYPPQIYLEYHRRFCHTVEYLEEQNWDFYEMFAAKIHIIRDYEMYVLNKEFSKVKIGEIDELWDKVQKYLHNFS